jgi:methionyl-tRNA synthetase
MKPEITFDEFLEAAGKLDIQLGTILEVEFLPKNKKMLKLRVAFGETERTVVTNIGDRLKDPLNELKRIQLPFIMNLPPRVVSGVESTAMIMVPEYNGEIQLTQITDGAKLL